MQHKKTNKIQLISNEMSISRLNYNFDSLIELKLKSINIVEIEQI